MGAGAVASREEREEVERWALCMSQVAGKKGHLIIAKFWDVLLSQKMQSTGTVCSSSSHWEENV